MPSPTAHKGDNADNNARPSDRKQCPGSGGPIIKKTKKPEYTASQRMPMQGSPSSVQKPENAASKASTKSSTPSSVQKAPDRSTHHSTAKPAVAKPTEMSSPAKAPKSLSERHCPYCDIIKEPACAVTKIYDHPWKKDFLVLQPIGPVAPGHVLVIPRHPVGPNHVQDASNDEVFGETCKCASRIAKKIYPGQDVNIMTNQGLLADQSVPHLHVHVIPRSPDDRLTLPWTGQLKDHYNTKDKPPHEESVRAKRKD